MVPPEWSPTRIFYYFSDRSATDDFEFGAPWAEILVLENLVYTAPKLAHTSSASTQNPLLDIKMVLVIDWETRIQQVECSVVRSEVCGSALGVVAPSH